MSLAERIAELTAALTPITDMALLLDLSPYELSAMLNDYDSPESRAYRKTKAQVALDMRIQDIELARAGSPTAAQNVAKYYNAMLLFE